MSFLTHFTRLAVATAALTAATYAESPKPPKAFEIPAWCDEMKIGPAWSNTFQDNYQGKDRVAALKGILLDLGDNHRALFDTETLRLVTAYQGKWKWGGTPWTGQHGVLITLANDKPLFNTTATPGWADPNGLMTDKRKEPGFGNLAHAAFKGYYRHGEKIVLNYSVNEVELLESVSQDGETLTRSFFVGKRDKEITLLVADEKGAFLTSKDHSKSDGNLNIVTSGGLVLENDSKTVGRLLARISRGGPAVFQLSMSRSGTPKVAAAPDFEALIAGGPPLYPQIIETKGVVSSDKTAPYVTDILTLPEDNPWKANLRFGGFDFIDEDSAALSTWNGDVWVVRGLKSDWASLKWQRIASGLFEPLGVKVVNGVIHVHGRDQITQLIDLNADGETDHFKTFNRDTIISSNFHEFAFELQTDKAGNFYFAKGSPVKGGGRGFDTILPNHGTVMKVSPDGKKMEVIATGLRAPGGLGVGPNGEITTGENEGTSQPCCKINYIPAAKLPAFFGTEASRQLLKNAPYTDPLCYLPMAVDNSGASQVWIPEGCNFGQPAGTLLHLSYGQSTVYKVLPVPRSSGALQGGVIKLPITLQSSAMRARFHSDSSLYVLGFRGWQTNAASETAVQRVRYNPGTMVSVPDRMEYTDKGIRLKFPTPLDPELANDITSYSSERWNYVRGPQYGSGEFSVDRPDRQAEKAAMEKESKEHKVHDTVKIEAAKLQSDGQTVELTLAGMKPCMTLKVTYDVEDKAGKAIKGEMHGTVYKD